MTCVEKAWSVCSILVLVAMLIVAPPAYAATDDSPGNDDNATTKTDEGDGADTGESDADDTPYADEVDDAIIPEFDPHSIDLTGQDLSKVPCLSVGAASGGRLVNGVRLSQAPGMLVRPSDNSWGTPETVAALKYSVAKVNQQFPGNTHLLMVGDISSESGGRLRHHRSHQAGRDADIGYYHKGLGQPRTFIDANASNLDVPRTWALLEAMMEDNKTEYVFIDQSVQHLLYNYVKYKLGAPDSYLQTVFSVASDNRRALIRHARGHRNHIHVRFWSPIAVAAARNYQYKDGGLNRIAQNGRDQLKGTAYIALNDLDKVDHGPMPKYQTVKEWRTVWTTHTVRKGDTPGGIANRYRVQTAQLMRWNGLKKGSLIRAGQRLKIQTRKMVEVQVPIQQGDWDVPDTALAKNETPPAPASEPVATAAGDFNVAATATDPVYKTVTRSQWATVKSGDNLWAIAKRNRTTVDKLAKLNGVSGKTTLKPGRKLKVKTWTEKVLVEPAVVPTAPAPAPAEEPAMEPAAEPAAEVEPASEVAAAEPTPKDMEYRVMQGDTIYTIATRFGLSVADVCAWNGLTASQKLEEGRKLILKVAPAADTQPDNGSATTDSNA